MTELKDALDAFFANSQKRVLIIKGKWGVGKTYAWREYIRTRSDLPEKSISYVSLFGVEDLQQLKGLILAKALPTKRVWLWRLATPLRFLLKLAKIIPTLKDYAEAPAILAELRLREYIICLDDLERRGERLKLSEILGFVSVLKEENKCRVVLIFNDDMLASADKQDLNTYREKVVDAEVEHRPSVAENARIGFPSGRDYPGVGRVLDALGVTNIRVIKFTEWNVKYFAPFVANSEKAVADALFRNVATLTCLFHLHGNDVDFDNLEGSVIARMFRKEGEKPSRGEQLLQQAEFADTDLDVFIVEFLRLGTCDKKGLSEKIGSLNAREIQSQTMARFRDAWLLYNGNFVASANDYLNAMRSLMKTHIHTLAQSEIDSVCEFVARLGQKELADSWRDEHFEKRVEMVTLEGIPAFRKRTSNPTLLAKLDARAEELQRTVSLKELVYGVVKKSGWSPHQVILLNSFREQDYFEWICSDSDPDLVIMLRSFQHTARGVTSDGIWNEICAKLDGALRRIAAKDEFNRMRVENLFHGTAIEAREERQKEPDAVSNSSDP